MKLLKTLSASLLVAATAGSAMAAPTVIHIAGSSAFRSAATIAIIDDLSGATPGGAAGTNNVYGANATAGKNISNDNFAIFSNTPIGTGVTASTVIIETSWTGSLAGVTDLTTGLSQAAFIDETNPTNQTAVNSGIIAPGTYLGATNLGAAAVFTTANEPVEGAFSDSLNATISKELATGTLSGSITGANGTFTTTTQIATAAQGSTVIDSGTSAFALQTNHVAIVCFEWVLGITAPGYTSVGNITQEEARALVQFGQEPQGLFTGTANTADTANYLYLTGRNEDSGTRIGAFSESQFGVTTAPFQWQIGDGAHSFTPIQLFPANSALATEKQISWAPAGHSGFSSGANVAFALTMPNTGSALTFTGKPMANTGASYFIGYVGLTDAATAITAGAKALNYNGVTFGPAAVINGSYTFWTFEHLYRLTSSTGNTIGTHLNNIADLVWNVDADVVYTGTAHTSGIYHTYSVGPVAGKNDYDFTTNGPAPGLFDALSISRSNTEGSTVH
jgi:hypothetical protein